MKKSKAEMNNAVFSSLMAILKNEVIQESGMKNATSDVIRFYL